MPAVKLVQQGNRMVPVPAEPEFRVPGSSGGKSSRRTSPVFMTASRAYATGEAAPVNQKALVNHTGKPVELLEIRFQIPKGARTTALSGGAFGCQLSYMGEQDMTNGFVPMWSFARSYNRMDESGFFGGCLNFVLKLARPLWLPPRGFITASFQNRGLTQEVATAQIGLAGRMLMDVTSRPRKLCIPYVSHWASKVFDAYGAADTDASTENDIINPFDVPLRCQRFVQHTNYFATAISTVGNFEVEDGLADVNNNLTQVRIIGSDGVPTIPVFSTISQIFSPMTQSWECEHDLAPGGYYLVYLNKLAPTNQSANAILAQQFFGLVGYREVRA